jgi:hypothetical protein
MFTRANLYYIWNSKKNFPIGGLLTWGGITIAAIILGVSDGIQGLNEISQLLTKSGSATPPQSASATPSQSASAISNSASKNTVWFVISIIVLPSLIGSVANFLKDSRDKRISSEISRQYLHPQLQQQLEGLYNTIASSRHPLQGNFRVYITIPYPNNFLHWNYQICFSHPAHINNNLISIDVGEGELGYLINQLKHLQSQKYIPQVLALTPNLPLGYNQISQSNTNLINQIFIVKNVAVTGLFDGDFLCGVLVVTTSEESNLNLLQEQTFKEQLTAFLQVGNERLITTIWRTTGGRS